MEWILTLFGVLVAIALFLYAYSAPEDVRRLLRARRGPKQLSKAPPRTPNYPTPRSCPICRSALATYDSLYATMSPASTLREGTGGEEKSQVAIHGCRYCYKPSATDKVIGRRPISGRSVDL